MEGQSLRLGPIRVEDMQRVRRNFFSVDSDLCPDKSAAGTVYGKEIQAQIVERRTVEVRNSTGVFYMLSS